MILVTVGSTLYPFARMTTLVGHLAHVLPRKETIIFQYGHASPHFLDTQIKPQAFMPHATILTYMRKARVIVCHGGPATIYQALSFGKIPWVLPREKKYGEHLNDHQVDFARFMESHKLIHIIRSDTPLSRIHEASVNIPPIRKNNFRLIHHLDTIVRESALRRHL